MRASSNNSLLVGKTMISYNINNVDVEVLEETSILEAARSADIYIPTICSHPDLPSVQSLELSDTIYQEENKFTNDIDASIDSI